MFASHVGYTLMLAILATSTPLALAFLQKIPTSTHSARLPRQIQRHYESILLPLPIGLLPLFLSDNDKETDQETASSTRGIGVVDLGDADDMDQGTVVAPTVQTSRPVAPFLSQGEIDPSTAKVDFSDPQQTRVIIYMILSLLPVLFLIPFMLSREFIPAEYLPPVAM